MRVAVFILTEAEVTAILARDLPGWTIVPQTLHFDELMGTTVLVTSGAQTEHVFLERNGVHRTEVERLKASRSTGTAS
jgi:hypothetical protein